MSKVFSPSTICVQACPPTAMAMAISTSATLTFQKFALARSTVNSRFGWPLMRKIATFSSPGTASNSRFDLLGQLLQFVEVGPDDLDGVIALDAGKRFHDVVADVLREVPIDADQLAVHLLVHGVDQLRLGARPQGPSSSSQPVALAPGRANACRDAGGWRTRR